MRLLVDENIDRRAVSLLRTAGHDVFYVREENPSTADPNLLQQATREQRTLLTYDKGFGELAMRRGILAPYSVVLFRLSGEVPSEARANFIFRATTIWEPWPPGIWTIQIRHNPG